ncbi:hypothetical protein AB6V29_14545 [Microbacterium sp. 20-116]|uniref:hypothetical protein n=1 Tax=Microbacterium sp. 20-116 TaxID=3239883 RepID=UPI0034E29BE9
MKGISVWRLVRDQFHSDAPPSIARQGAQPLQFSWAALAALLGLAYGLSAPTDDPGAAVLAANAVFTALSVTMAMLFWPRAINAKTTPGFNTSDERWHVYRLTTQLFWTVLVGIVATGLAVAQLAVPSHWLLSNVVSAVTVSLTMYQVLLLGQSVFRLYAATFWMNRA